MRYSLLLDERFDKGFNLKGLNSIRDGHTPIKSFSLSKEAPEWLLCQWNSKYNLKDGNFVVSKDKYEIFDKSKHFTCYSTQKLVFNLDASQEYDAPRDASEPWPHLLIEQEITKNNKVCELESLVYDAIFRLEILENFMGDQERQHHTTQFVWVLTLKDDNPASPSYGHFIWVVLPIFDSRYQFSPFFMNQDMALPDGEFIYSFSSDTFFEKTLWDKKPTKLHFDLMPHIPTILQSAQSKGYMVGTKLEDLVVSSTNMGFEITGTYRCQISVENLALTAKRR